MIDRFRKREKRKKERKKTAPRIISLCSVMRFIVAKIY